MSLDGHSRNFRESAIADLITIAAPEAHKIHTCTKRTINTQLYVNLFNLFFFQMLLNVNSAMAMCIYAVVAFTAAACAAALPVETKGKDMEVYPPPPT